MLTKVPLIEPANIPEFFVNGIARIEDLQGNIAVTFFNLHRPLIGWPGEVERVAALRLIGSVDTAHRSVMQVSEAMQELDARIRATN